MKISLEIHPSFLNSCYLEIQERTFTIRIQTNHFMVNHKVEDKTWIFAIDDDVRERLTTLTQEIIKDLKPDPRLILDGVSLKCSFQTETILKEYDFRCPELNTKELELTLTYLDLVTRLNIDNNLNDYLELLEGYFLNRLPLKEFDEEPYRLRVYGTLSIYEKEGLTEAVNRASEHEHLVLDMRNFQGMGTALYECFEPLKRIKNLNILANDSAFDQIISMGFNLNQVERVQ